MAKSITLLFLLLSQMQNSLAASTDTKPKPPLSEQLKCYSLPYGGIGFASHLIMCYVALMLIFQRSPWKLRKTTHKSFGQIISATSVVNTIIHGTISISRCNFDRSVQTVAVWEILFSAFFGCLCYNAAYWIGRSTDATEAERKTGWTHGLEKGLGIGKTTASQATPSSETPPQVDKAPQASSSEPSPQDSPPEYTPTPEAPSTTTEEAKPAQKGCPQDIFWWIPIYSIGASCCIAGLISLVVREIGQKRAIERITFVFGTFSATLVVLAILACFLGLLDKREDHGWDLFFVLVISLLMMVVLTIGVIGPLYSDWILGALAGDFGGVPTPKAQTIYWLYFTSRLLPFLSF